MRKSKWYVSLSVAALLLGGQLPHVVADQAIEMETVIAESVKFHQVKENDKIEDIAKELEMDSELLKMIQSGSKYKLSKQGNWAILYKKQFLILADEHIHDYVVYDITLENKEKKQPFTKIEVTDEIKAILEVLHEKYGHLDGSHDHDHAGHDHSHEGHDHSHAGHDHSHEGHDHSHEGHDHSHEGHDHSHVGHDHSHEGHDHNHEGQDHSHEGHDHSHEGHDHSHEGHDHSHEGHDHSHAGHDHSHEGDDHGHEGHDHGHEGDDHSHEGDDHSHEGDDHSHEGDDHSHEGHDHSHEEEGHYDDISKIDPKYIVSEDDLGYVVKHGNHFHFIPKKQKPKDVNPTDNQQTDSTLSVEEQAMLDLKKAYIGAIFNVPKESVKVSNNFLVFSMPGEDYDPTHIHPFSVPIDRVIVPEVTGDAETDFENELRSMSYLVGVPVRNLKIKDNKFLMNHGSHYHYLNILAVDGIKPFYEHQLPDINGSYVAGDLDVAAVKNRVQEILVNAQTKFMNDTKQLRRIEYVLEGFLYKLDDLQTNSTEGYLEMLKQFEAQYVEVAMSSGDKVDTGNKTPETDMSKETEETAATPKESEIPKTPELDADTIGKRDALVETIREMNLKGYSVTREDLIKQLNSLSSANQVNDFVKFIDEIKHARPETIFAMKYLDYVMVNLELPIIDNQLREELSDLARLTFEAQMGGKVKSEALIVRLIEARKRIEVAKEANVANDNRQNGEKYQALTEDLRGKSRYAHIVEFVKGVRSLVETYNNPYLPNVTDDLTVPDFSANMPAEVVSESETVSNNKEQPNESESPMMSEEETTTTDSMESVESVEMTSETTETVDTMETVQPTAE